jgi:hypothetical protein
MTSAEMLASLLKQHSTTYPSLSPRIMKTLLLALVSTGRSKGTREGAIRGLIAVGKEAIRKGLVECGGARVVGSECAQDDPNHPVVAAVLVSGRLTPCFGLSMSSFNQFFATERLQRDCSPVGHASPTKPSGGR